MSCLLRLLITVPVLITAGHYSSRQSEVHKLQRGCLDLLVSRFSFFTASDSQGPKAGPKGIHNSTHAQQ